MNTTTDRPAVATGTMRGCTLTIVAAIGQGGVVYRLSLHRHPQTYTRDLTRGELLELADITPESYPGWAGPLSPIREAVFLVGRPASPPEPLTYWHAALARCAREVLAAEAEASHAAGAAWYSALARQAEAEQEGSGQ